MTTRLTLALALLCALLAGALARDLLLQPAHAGDAPVVRADVDRVVRALEAQVAATKDVAREVRDASRACK